MHSSYNIIKALNTNLFIECYNQISGSTEFVLESPASQNNAAFRMQIYVKLAIVGCDRGYLQLLKGKWRPSISRYDWGYVCSRSFGGKCMQDFLSHWYAPLQAHAPFSTFPLTRMCLWDLFDVCSFVWRGDKIYTRDWYITVSMSSVSGWRIDNYKQSQSCNNCCTSSKNVFVYLLHVFIFTVIWILLGHHYIFMPSHWVFSIKFKWTPFRTTTVCNGGFFRI